MTSVPHVKLDTNKPSVWAALIYASIRGGVKMEDILYDNLEKYPDGFYLSAGDSAIFIHPAIVNGLQ